MSAGYERERKKSFQKTRRSKQIYKESAEVTPFGVHSNYRSIEPYPCTNSDRVFGYFHKSRFQCPDIEDREQVRLLADFYICLRAWELREGEVVSEEGNNSFAYPQRASYFIRWVNVS